MIVSDFCISLLLNFQLSTIEFSYTVLSWAPESNLNVLDYIVALCICSLDDNMVIMCSNLNIKGFFYLKKMSEKKSVVCVCVCVCVCFPPRCRNCFPWVRGTGSWSRLLCTTAFLSQAQAWPSCSSSWVCLFSHFQCPLMEAYKTKFSLSSQHLIWI